MKDTIKLFFFGDSIMLGQGVSLHQSWVSRISAAIGLIAEKRYRKIITINASINGDTTRTALERMPFDVQSHGVDIIVIQFGLNDCNCWESDGWLPRVSPDAFKANLNEIIQRAQVFGARKTFLLTNHPVNKLSNSVYNKAIRNVSHEHPSVELIDVEINFYNKKLQDLLLDDGIHPNLKGHDLYFNSLLNIISHAVLEVL